ncbi:MAG: DUF2207 domain-containing protein [Henriciella sp.]|nr:DUF2207 domain-containing protein [Henriciella sp.]
MTLLRTIFTAIALLAVFSASSQAQEEIRRFDVAIDVKRNGDIFVTETIAVNVEGREIRRGILRDLPAFYRDDETGGNLPYRYKILGVKKDGQKEPYERESDGYAVQLRIGDADRYLDYREHVYEIRYRVKNQIQYFENQDELYWNVTGNYWVFPIQSASARITLPDGARVTEMKVYTGGLGESARDARYVWRGDAHVFETTQPLGVREGLTISLGIEKGVIDPPSLSDKGWLWWARNGSLTALLLSFGGLLMFYYRSFDRVGRDPAKGPVFPQYEPPEGYSPAAAHQIYHRTLSGHDGLIASLMYLASKGLMRIDVDQSNKKKTTLTKLNGADTSGLAPELANLYEDVFSSKDKVKLGEKYDAKFTAAYNQFKSSLSDRYGSAYFKWNPGYVIAGGALSFFAIIFAIVQHSYWTGWHTLAIVALIGLNGLFMYLMPAPTRRGQNIRTHLEGFRLYMDKAEKLQLNSVEVGSDAPPPMTVERYETFLPYAIALGVEKPWTKHFERLIPEEAKAYDPTWTNVSSRTFGSMGGMTKGIVSGMSSGVSTAMPQSSSSGSSGGGFSGGGGGGGGGGGW